MTTDHHTRSDIVRRAGVDNDVLTFWLRRDLIRPIERPSGRGNTLRFDPYQVRVAKMLANGRAAGLNLDALQAIAIALQRAIKTFLRSEVAPSMLSAIMEEIEDPGRFQQNLAAMKRVLAIQHNDGVADLIKTRDVLDYENRVVDAARVYLDDDVEYLWLFMQLFEADGYLMAYRDDTDGQWKVERNPVLDGAYLPAPACIVLNFAALAPLGEPEPA